MCGICGIALPIGSQQAISKELIIRMRDTMVHRGPDGAGLFMGVGVALGHRRLSIIDLSGGAQPMSSVDGDLHIVFNGKIFNHPELKLKLEQSGVQYRTRCDTETILRLYERERINFVHLLRGTFALGIWSCAKHELILVRDRFGVKPLYYAHKADGALYFASEIKALLEAGAVRAELNLLSFPDFLANHAPSGQETMFEGIHRLPAGHMLIWRNGETEIRQYWDLRMADEEEDVRPDCDLCDEYLARLTESVRLMSDVPLGVFLSGGIDSAAITAITSNLMQEPIKTFSVGFAEREANEIGYARLMASRYGTDHHEVTLNPEEFFASIPRLIWHEDEPMAYPSSVALYFVSRLASEQVKVVLTGEGSDETLAGYNRYRITLINTQIGQVYHRVTPHFMRQLIRLAVQSLPDTSILRKRLDRTFLTLPPTVDMLYFENFAVFSREWQARLLEATLQKRLASVDAYDTLHQLFEEGNGRTMLDRMLYTDTKTYMQELLMKQDRMSMAASIESRVPFLDHPLVEFVARLPDRLKLRNLTTKFILRQAMQKYLPDAILKRKKMGFPVPVGPWLRNRFRPLLDDFILGERTLARGLFNPEVLRELVANHDAGKGNHAERLWSLINLEIWHRVFIDHEPVDDILPDRRIAFMRRTL